MRSSYVTENYYELLNIKRDATPEEIKRAYYNAAKKYHPDKHLDINTTELMQKLNLAKEILLDAHKRSAYDIHLPPEVAVYYDDSRYRNQSIFTAPDNCEKQRKTATHSTNISTFKSQKSAQKNSFKSASVSDSGIENTEKEFDEEIFEAQKKLAHIQKVLGALTALYGPTNETMELQARILKLEESLQEKLAEERFKKENMNQKSQANIYFSFNNNPEEDLAKEKSFSSNKKSGRSCAMM